MTDPVGSAARALKRATKACDAALADATDDQRIEIGRYMVAAQRALIDRIADLAGCT